MDVDLAIVNGTIVDGTGRPGYPGDLIVSGSRILDILPPGRVDAQGFKPSRSIDAGGLTVAPGFIDLHSHTDFMLLKPDHGHLAAPFLEQGCTTVVGGNCGFSPAPLAECSPHLPEVNRFAEFISGGHVNLEHDAPDSFLQHLESQGLALNLAMLAGHGLARWSIWGRDFSYPGDREMTQLDRLLEEALDAGYFGLSLGLGYPPGLFSTAREIERVATLAAGRDALLAVHLKVYTRIAPSYPLNPFGPPHNIRALKEMLDLAEKTGVRLQISHLIFVGEKAWPSAEKALGLIERAHDRGLDVCFDAFPYHCGNTTIYIAYPDWFARDIENNFLRQLALLRLSLEWDLGFPLLGMGLEDFQLMRGGHLDYRRFEGLFFPEIARQMGVTLKAAFLEISRRSRGMASCLLHKYSGNSENEEPLMTVLAHPLGLAATDALVCERGLANPAAYGAFPKFIQRGFRELSRFSLEDAVSRMTGKTAARLGLKDRGTIAPGNRADLTLFDALTIKDNTTPANTEASPSGIHSVLVNGVEVVRNGRADPGIKAGSVLRRQA